MSLRGTASIFAIIFMAVIALMLSVRLTIGLTIVHSDQQLQDKITPIEDSPELDPRKLDLGGRLFADTIMSGKGRLACATCHDLKTSGTIGLKRTIGYEGRVHRFNAPTIFNVANNYRLGWRGNFTSLTFQNEQILLDANIMANSWDSLLKRLKMATNYNRDFLAIYGQEPSKDNVLDVLTTFQRSLATTGSRFDQYLQGSQDALSSTEKRGYRLFQDYGCISCHQGSNIGGNLFQKFGIFASPPGGDPTSDGDLGRFTTTRNEKDRGYFRVPSLRNVAVTAPYFHDGRAATLDEAVRVMAQTQVGQDMSKEDIDAIVQFLTSLTGNYKGRPLSINPAKSEMSLED
jgi:cytochrome c peroxidase